MYLALIHSCIIHTTTTFGRLRVVARSIGLPQDTPRCSQSPENTQKIKIYLYMIFTICFVIGVPMIVLRKCLVGVQQPFAGEKILV